MLKILRISDVVGMKIFTDSGDYVGSVEEAEIVDNKVYGWRVKIARDAGIAAYLGGVRGLIIPHQYVKAMSEIIIISRAAVPAKEEITDNLKEESEEVI